MMEIVLPRSWKEDFALAAALKREDILYEEKMRRAALREQERRDDRQEAEEKKEREETQEWEDAALASAGAKIKFDGYDAKTVEALMDNRQAAEALQRKIDAARAEAYILPDGRKVYKTRDGQKVYDEQKREIPCEILDPSAIDDKKPRWETLAEMKDEGVRLNAEHRTLIEYQTKLDEARARVDKGDISEKDLKKIEADLAASAPEAVRRKLGLDKPETSPALSKQVTRAVPVRGRTDDLIQQTGLAAPIPGPQ